MFNKKCAFHGNDHPDFLCPRKNIAQSGPERIIIDRRGTAVTPQVALQECGIIPTVVFLRHDGWSLGAPIQFEKIAYRMWSGEWIAFTRQPFKDFRPMAEYERK